MTATATEPEAPASGTAPCPRCGAPLQPGQDWCLECGAAATTRIVPAPGWPLPVAIVALVLAVAGAAAAWAIVEITNDTDRTVAERPVVRTITQPPADGGDGKTSTEKDAKVPGAKEAAEPAVASWPEGERGWTVVLFSTSDRAGARRFAETALKAGAKVGVLRSTEFSNLRPGLWVVFSGTYKTQARAQSVAQKAQAGGVRDAYTREVIPKKPRR